LRGLTDLIYRFLTALMSGKVWNCGEMKAVEHSMARTSPSQPCADLSLHVKHVSSLASSLSHMQVCCGVHRCIERTGSAAPGKKC